MVHSVFDWQKLRYDYFVSPAQASVGGWKPLTGLGIPAAQKAALVGSARIGIDIEEALPLLPANARKVGVGLLARGQVCRRQRGPAIGQLGSSGILADTRAQDRLSIFLLGFAVGSFFGQSKLLTIGALTTSALLVGLDAGRSMTEEPKS